MNFPVEDKVLLPQSIDELDEFVYSLGEQFNFPVNDDTYEAVAVKIMHLPNTQAFATREEFGHAALKYLANKAAYEKLQEFAAKRKADEEFKKSKGNAGDSERVPPKSVQDA